MAAAYHQGAWVDPEAFQQSPSSDAGGCWRTEGRQQRLVDQAEADTGHVGQAGREPAGIEGASLCTHKT